jgi:hypothetical protein
MLIQVDAGPTQVKRLATNIYRAAGRMRELLADLSSVARGDRPTPEICDIGEVIAAASDAASANTNNHNVQILVKVPDGIELPLIRSRMERVFFNLIANALEAMPAGGSFTLYAGEPLVMYRLNLKTRGLEFLAGFATGCSNRLLQQASRTASGLDWPSLATLSSTTAATFGPSPPLALVLLFAFP